MAEHNEFGKEGEEEAAAYRNSPVHSTKGTLSPFNGL